MTNFRFPPCPLHPLPPHRFQHIPKRSRILESHVRYVSRVGPTCMFNIPVPLFTLCTEHSRSVAVDMRVLIFFSLCSNSTPGCESSLSNVHNVRNSRNNVSVVTGWDESMKPWFVQGVRCKARLCFFPSGWLAQSIPVRCPRCKPLLLPAHGAGFANDVNIYFWRQTKDVQRKFEIRNVICPSHFGSNHFGSTLGSSVFARSR